MICLCGGQASRWSPWNARLVTSRYLRAQPWAHQSIKLKQHSSEREREREREGEREQFILHSISSAMEPNCR
uniref:Uncharacterized protein n=1 Tax=Populus trichocarpa TaxID=3694 RepID=B9IAS8_POPTR